MQIPEHTYSKVFFLQQNKIQIRFISLFLSLAISLNTLAQENPPAFNEAINKNTIADSTAKVFINSISINGNKKTKNYIIEREMRFKEGDSVIASNLFELIKLSRDLVYNTTLFTDVKIEPSFINGTDININVTVKEKWYIYPSPQFQLIDRNFNEWIKTYHADLERVVYGAKFAHYNLSGRRDQLRVYLLNGYARNFAVTYSAPYSNRQLTEGFSAGASYTQNREVTFGTNANNKLQRYNSGGFSRKSLALNGAYIKRNGYYRRHVYSIGFNYTQVDDSITGILNKAYFNNNKNNVGYPEIGYSFQYINTNNVQYPLTGLIFGATGIKRGLGWKGGINMFSLSGNVGRYVSHGRNWYSVFEGLALLKLPFNQAYINQRALGYGEYFMRGLENYVVDGVASAVGKYTIKKKIVAFEIPIPIKNKLVPKIPITIFAKTYADVGYVYSKGAYNSRLNNAMLYTGGFGIDILTLYDINLKLEYSFNQLGEKGLFLHTKGGF